MKTIVERFITFLSRFLLKNTIPIILFFSIFFGGFIFYSFRLTEVPKGVTNDEISIGYNALLIGETLRDESGRFLPFFALTAGGKDWKQPFSIYATLLSFKLFGPSLYSLRLVNVLVAVFSLMVLAFLGYLVLGRIGLFSSMFFFLISPSVLMHAHIGQENIVPVIFISLFLLLIFLFQKTKRLALLLVSGIVLGVSIYSYKGMRAIVPPLSLVTFLYLIYLSTSFKIFSRKLFLPAGVFLLGLIPFLGIMPLLQRMYGGAVFDSQVIGVVSIYDFFYNYLSHFDISALFIAGDATVWHSTGIHGMFLLCSLPLFLIGIYQSISQRERDRGFWLFLVCGFFLLPLLFGPLGFVHRFSRLLVYVPFYVLFCSLGLQTLLAVRFGKKLVFVFVSLLILNFLDFGNYYFNRYSDAHTDQFLTNYEQEYRELAHLSREQRKIVYIYNEDYKRQNDEAKFYETAFFDQPFKLWYGGTPVPTDGILATTLPSIPGASRVKNDSNTIFFYVAE